MPNTLLLKLSPSTELVLLPAIPIDFFTYSDLLDRLYYLFENDLAEWRLHHRLETFYPSLVLGLIDYRFKMPND